MNESSTPLAVEPPVAFDHGFGHRAFCDALYRRLADETAEAIKRIRLDPGTDIVVVVAPPSLQDSEGSGVRIDVGVSGRNSGPDAWDYAVVNPGDPTDVIESHIRRAACRARLNLPR